jgi:hypothetical protein
MWVAWRPLIRALAFSSRGLLKSSQLYLDYDLSTHHLPPHHGGDRHGRTRTAFALRAGIRRAGLRALLGGRHQSGPGRHFRGRPQHDRQLAAETSRVRPVGEAGTRSRRRSRRARALFARRRLYVREHPSCAPPGRADHGAAHGAQAARCPGLHLLAAQPPSPAMARPAQADRRPGTGLERRAERGFRAGEICRRGRSCRTSSAGVCFSAGARGCSHSWRRRRRPC